MKHIAFFLGLVTLMVFTSCAKCNNEAPTARVLNNGTAEANLQIISSDGDIIAITDLPNGSISSVKSYSPGTTTVNCSIEGIQLTETVNMVECFTYDITISGENKIVIFSQEKS